MYIWKHSRAIEYVQTDSAHNCLFIWRNWTLDGMRLLPTTTFLQTVNVKPCDKRYLSIINLKCRSTIQMPKQPSIFARIWSETPRESFFDSLRKPQIGREMRLLYRLSNLDCCVSFRLLRRLLVPNSPSLPFQIQTQRLALNLFVVRAHPPKFSSIILQVRPSR